MRAVTQGTNIGCAPISGIFEDVYVGNKKPYDISDIRILSYAVFNNDSSACAFVYLADEQVVVDMSRGNDTVLVEPEDGIITVSIAHGSAEIDINAKTITLVTEYAQPKIYMLRR